VEAVIEDLKVKRNLFSQLDKRLSSESIIASNTSSFPIIDLSEGISPKRKERFIGLHFFNPAPIMKLVEVICPRDIDRNISQDLAAWLCRQGKKAVLCQDRPGFIVNRIARNFYGEALRIANSDDQKRYSQIDRALREAGGFKMGPFELMDLIGIDVNLDVTRSVWNAFDKGPRFAPHFLQQQMVEKGRLGKKTGRGFFIYE
ncbi:MAG: 3-hydroxyacyl-CoA dehydrogenase NAD-binding domain-containing protein, partial [Halobacteriovoraceae bacterium]|nr:3-hydroxyacyl-CoA dehydrogenase NAD-binding domain-containing protein [Halobacteriovoraceae bacterium]